MVPNAPKRKECTKTWVYDPMVWITSIRCDKLWHDFVAQTFTLIAPVWRVLHQVSCSSETVANAPKWKETHQNMRLGSNGMDRKHSLWKILTRHRVTDFCINCTSLAHFRAIAKTIPNAPKWKETHQNMSLGSNGVDREHTLWNIPTRLRGTNFCINCTSLACVAASFMQ